MPFKTEQDIVTIHTRAIIHDPKQAGAAAFYLDRYSTTPCIKTVFKQFLDHGGRAFHNFTGGDLIGQMIGKETNTGHG